jgi:hypothetical protein
VESVTEGIVRKHSAVSNQHSAKEIDRAAKTEVGFANGDIDRLNAGS